MMSGRTLTTKDQSIGRRLVTIMLMTVLAVAALFGALVLGYMFFQEREEATQHLSVQAELLAKQSAAPLLFRDHHALAAQLGALRLIDSLRWAVVVQEGRVVARYGFTSAEFPAIRDRLGGAGSPPQRAIESDVRQVAIREPIVIDGQHLGDLYVVSSFAQYNHAFVQLVAVFATLALVVMVLVMPVVWFFIRQVTLPLKDLAAVADRVFKDGVTAERATVVRADEVGQLGEAFNRMLENVERSQASLQALVEQGNRIREDERVRIARDVHDGLGQLMTRLKFDIAWIRQHAGDPPGILERSGEMSDVLDQAVQSVRRISWELRPGILDTLGLPEAIEWLGTDFSKRTGVGCQVDVDAIEESIAPDLASQLFRICQELLTNVARHAGASSVLIVLEASERMLTLIVEDNGAGIRPADDGRPRLGLQGVRERVRSLGGSVGIVTHPEFEGTSVTVKVPLGEA